MRQVGGARAATARPRAPRWLTVGLALVVGALAYLGIAAQGQAGDDSLLAHAPAAPEPPPVAPAGADGSSTEARRDLSDRAGRAGRDMDVARHVDATDEAPDVVAFARVGDVELGLPHGEPVAVAFHEASRPDALELAPIGRLLANDNATRYTAPDDTAGPQYRVLSSRGRVRPATSAVDVVVPQGATAAAPVTGTVVEARQYLLYGSLRDWRVVIEPDARPDVHVVLIHLHEPAVRVGDRVRAGDTTLAVVRQLPFASHVDYVVGERLPHVHVEVRPATAPKPHDPNAPALDASERLEEVSGAGRGNS